MDLPQIKKSFEKHKEEFISNFKKDVVDLQNKVLDDLVNSKTTNKIVASDNKKNLSIFHSLISSCQYC